MDSLRSTVDGSELYGVIARVLRKHQRDGGVTPECLAELHDQLDLYARDALTLPAMRIRARLLQQHIGAYLPDSPLPAAPASSPDSGPPDLHIEHIEAAAPPETHAGAGPIVEGTLERPAEQAEQASAQDTEKYRALLRSEKDAWQAIYGTVKDYHKLKQAWMKSLDELARQRDALEEKLVKTTEHLGQLDAERERLRAELERARSDAKRQRLLPAARAGKAVARATGLPRRETFVRELETEIKRSKRSGAPLALGLIGLDALEPLAETQGEAVAEAVLRCYATEILSNFRAYDRVAFYDRDRFAVMFPETRMEGARRALEKAYKRAAETHLSHDDKSFPLPPFAAALVLYSAGEEPARFLERADRTLATARSTGQVGVVVA